jgi:hypothetical protein
MQGMSVISDGLPPRQTGVEAGGKTTLLRYGNRYTDPLYFTDSGLEKDAEGEK